MPLDSIFKKPCVFSFLWYVLTLGGILYPSFVKNLKFPVEKHTLCISEVRGHYSRALAVALVGSYGKRSRVAGVQRQIERSNGVKLRIWLQQKYTFFTHTHKRTVRTTGCVNLKCYKQDACTSGAVARCSVSSFVIMQRGLDRCLFFSIPTFAVFKPSIF